MVRAGTLRESSKSTRAAVGMKPVPKHNIFSSVVSSVIIVNFVTSEPVPAVVGIAKIGKPGSSTIRGNL